MSDDAELDPLRVAFLVTHTFEALGVRYFIGGSLASIFHGLIRTTNDADLVAELAASHVTALVAALEGSFYIDAGSIREAIGAPIKVPEFGRFSAVCGTHGHHRLRQRPESTHLLLRVGGPDPGR